MRRPGTWLRTLASRVCSATTMERLVDPVIGDLQAEYADATREGRTWGRWGALIVGYVAFAKVFLLCGLFGTRQAWHNWNGEDVRGLSRVVWSTLAAIIGLTMFLALPELLRLTDFARLSDPSTTQMALYLLPSTMALSVPLGLSIGAALGVGRRPRSRRLIAALLLIAALMSVFSFTNLGWLTPAFNQLYREQVFNRLSGDEVSRGRLLPKGYNELTFTELRHAIDDPDTRYPRASSTYHTRLALVAAPLTFAMFGLVIATRRRMVRLGALVLAAFGYYVLLWLGSLYNRAGVVPAQLGPWIPQIALLLTTFVIGTRGRSPEHAPEHLDAVHRHPHC